MTKHDQMKAKFKAFMKIRLDDEKQTLQRLMYIFEEIYWSGWFDGEDYQKLKDKPKDMND